MMRAAVGILVLTSACSAQQEQPAPEPFVIEVVDESGAPVPGAVLRFVPSALSRVHPARGYDEGLDPFYVDWSLAMERRGQRINCDADGVARFPWPRFERMGEWHRPPREAPFMFDVRAEDRWFVGSIRFESSPLTVVAHRDRSIEVIVLDVVGEPLTAAEVGLYRFWTADDETSRGSLAWRGRTHGTTGRVNLPPFDLDTRDGSRWEVRLRIPCAEPIRHALRADQPERVVTLRAPEFGSLEVGAPVPSDAFVRLAVRRDDVEEDSRHHGASQLGLPRGRSLVNGVARFPHVGLGVELEVTVDWTLTTPSGGSGRATTKSVAGPGRAGEHVRVEFETLVEEPTPSIGDAAGRTWYVTSTSIDNDRFMVCLAIDSRESSPRTIELDDRMIQLPGWHALEQADESGHAFRVVDSIEEARAWASALGVPLATASGPDWTLEGEFRLVEPPKLGAPVTVELSMRNASERPIHLMLGGWGRMATRHGRFDFRATHDGVELVAVSGENLGGLDAYRLLAPGDSIEQRAQLDRWFPMLLPGHWIVDVEFSVDVEHGAIEYSEPHRCAPYSGTVTETLRGRVEFDIEPGKPR